MIEPVTIGAATLYLGDCRDVMAALPERSVDAVVCDPPYGLGFMGKDWDHSVPGVHFWQEALRVAKPGAHLVAFGGTRTFHRLMVAIEDAGWELRDTLMWVYGSGFPKSRNLDGEWKGWGTALKPAWEPIILARKPLAGTVAANVSEFGTGALNIDGCRIAASDGYTENAVTQGINTAQTSYAPAGVRRTFEPQAAGRWPANLIHDGSEEVLAAFPDAPGQLADASSSSSRKSQNAYGDMKRGNEAAAQIARLDSGSAARFFYCAKASREDRNDGCDGLPERQSGMVSNTRGQHMTRRDGGAPGPAANHHPTVKPTDLMRYLCRLVTPPGGLVLDPFSGSGSTGRAAVLEGMRYVGIELNPDYHAIAIRRVGKVQRQGRLIA